jgi:CspA family cold shock protein
MSLHYPQFQTRRAHSFFVCGDEIVGKRRRVDAWGLARAISDEEQDMPIGTIARLLIDKGFGFIRDENGLEHFFHRSAVRGAVFELLREGQRVEFVIEESQKGPRAGDVRLIEG